MTTEFEGSTNHECNCENAAACVSCSCDENKPLSPVIDAEVEQCKIAIDELSAQIASVYAYHDRLAEIESRGYTERLAERCRELVELQPPACLGKFWEQPEPRTKCDTCAVSARCL